MAWKTYNKKNKRTSIVAYNPKKTSFEVRFGRSQQRRTVYTYPTSAKLIQLANAGRGLNSYIKKEKLAYTKKKKAIQSKR